MLRYIHSKHSILVATSVLKYCPQQFHVSRKVCIRQVKHARSSTKYENSERDFGPPQPRSSSEDIFGIESDEGVITLSKPQTPVSEAVRQRNLREKFHCTSFGVVRYDSENKLKFHGQYRDTDSCVFPYFSSEHVEVSKDLPNSTANRFPNKAKKLLNERKVNRDFESARTKELNESYIDENYFGNSVKENTNCNNAINQASEKLNFVDQAYFGNASNLGKDRNEIFHERDRSTVNNATLSETTREFFGTELSDPEKALNCNEEKYLKANDSESFDTNLKSDAVNENYIDELYFHNIPEKKSQTNLTSVSKEELSFVDLNYFDALKNSEKVSQKIMHEKHVSELLDEKIYNTAHSEGENIAYNYQKMDPSQEELKMSYQNYMRTLTPLEKGHFSTNDKTNSFDENCSENSSNPRPQMSSNAENVPNDIPASFDYSNREIFKANEDEKNYTKLESVIADYQNLNKESIYDKYVDDSQSNAALSSHESIKTGDLLKSDFKIRQLNEKLRKINATERVKPNEAFSSGIEINQHREISKDYDQIVQQDLEDCLVDDTIDDRLESDIECDSETNTSVVANDKPDEPEELSTAHDFVSKLRKEREVFPPILNKEKDTTGEKFDSKGFRILKNQVPDLTKFTRDEIFNLLKNSIVYLDDNLLVLNKPYGIVMHDSETSKVPCLSTFLDDLAKELDRKATNPQLFTLHRLDKETTGCLLIARNEMMAQHLKSLFVQRRIIKKYWIVTSRVPDPPEGIIDIPISEGSVNSMKRMVLHPKLPKDTPYRNHSRRGKEAITSYQVIAESGNAALVEACPKTGIKHQIRIHFGFGLSCPIIGDHKYSHFDKLAPQKLPSDILQKLAVRQSKVRYIPMLIHAKSIVIPEYHEDKGNLFVNTPIPDHIRANLKRLKFRRK